jgi:hypothetical protein
MGPDPCQSEILRRLVAPKITQPIQADPKWGRNWPCPCGSGKKYKKCCLYVPQDVQAADLAQRAIDEGVGSLTSDELELLRVTLDKEEQS